MIGIARHHFTRCAQPGRTVRGLGLHLEQRGAHAGRIRLMDQVMESAVCSHRINEERSTGG